MTINSHTCFNNFILSLLTSHHHFLHFLKIKVLGVFMLQQSLQLFCSFCGDSTAVNKDL